MAGHGQLTTALRDGEVATVKSLLREPVTSIDVHDDARVVQPRFLAQATVRTRSGLNWQSQVHRTTTS